jgi:glyoxylase-like metal-dependent hydrolase (beta-lactamase superfamily II)
VGFQPGEPAHASLCLGLAARARWDVGRCRGRELLGRQDRVEEGFAYAGGSFSKAVDTNFSVFLVQHDDDRFHFDAGLGGNIVQQYQQDMPRWSRPLFGRPDSVMPAVAQLQAGGVPPIKRIVLSHAHWDHASGLEDFPGAEVWVSEEELQFVQHAASGIGHAWQSQVRDKPLAWRALPFEAAPYEGFERSLDLYGDGSVVLVPLFGHTPGSVGMFVRVSSGRRYFFVGDAVWNAAALAGAAEVLGGTPAGRP